MGKLEGKLPLVTGGTSGIGQAITYKFANEGATVILVGRNREKGAQVASEITAQGGDSKFLPCDVSSVEEIMGLRKIVNTLYGKLDILVNCAGIWHTQLLEDITLEEYELIFKTNTASVIFMTQAFMNCLERSHGNIINIASIGGIQAHIAGRSQYLYAASKAATIQFSQLCALNYAKSVRVNCVCPGPTDTAIFINRDFSWVKDQIPMERIGMPEDVANAALFLASDDAAYITGSVFPIDGGSALR